jgi:hypothetical protein
MSTAAPPYNDDKTSTSSATTTDPQLYTILESMVGQPTLSQEHVDLIGKLAFGNAEAKLAIANCKGLIDPKLIDFYLNITTDGEQRQQQSELSFLKSLRACIVNCSVARGKCHNDRRLYDKIVQRMIYWKQQTQNKASEDTSNIAMTMLHEYITTLCALCMNDDDNTRLFKQALLEEEQNSSSSSSSNVESLQDLTPQNNDDDDVDDRTKKIIADLKQRITFLQALLDSL